MAAKFDFDIDQGTDFEFVLTLKDGDGLPRDITGHTYRAHAREYLEGELAFSFSFVVDPDQVNNTGQVSMVLDNGSSSAIPGDATKYVYDIEEITPALKVNRVLEGTITLHREITR